MKSTIGKLSGSTAEGPRQWELIKKRQRRLKADNRRQHYEGTIVWFLPDYINSDNAALFYISLKIMLSLPSEHIKRGGYLRSFFKNARVIWRS